MAIRCPLWDVHIEVLRTQEILDDVHIFKELTFSQRGTNQHEVHPQILKRMISDAGKCKEENMRGHLVKNVRPQRPPWAMRESMDFTQIWFSVKQGLGMIWLCYIITLIAIWGNNRERAIQRRDERTSEWTWREVLRFKVALEVEPLHVLMNWMQVRGKGGNWGNLTTCVDSCHLDSFSASFSLDSFSAKVKNTPLG